MSPSRWRRLVERRVISPSAKKIFFSRLPSLTMRVPEWRFMASDWKMSLRFRTSRFPLKLLPAMRCKLGPLCPVQRPQPPLTLEELLLATLPAPPLTLERLPLAKLPEPPLTPELSPLASLLMPPLTLDSLPLAVLFPPPLTEVWKPLAALFTPPLTEDHPPLAVLFLPPLTEA